MILSCTNLARLALCAAALGLAAGSPAALGQAADAGPGWTPVIAGAPESMTDEEFEKAVVAELPEELFDRSTNFTSDDAYQPESDYRLVMVFHGEGDGPEPGKLCTVDRSNPEDVETTKPELGNIMETTGVTAAFCQDAEALSTATDKISGQAEPGQLSFAFLVSDVAKQLFPDGFQVMPQPQAISTFDEPQ